MTTFRSLDSIAAQFRKGQTSSLSTTATSPQQETICQPRVEILNLGILVGELSRSILLNTGLDENGSSSIIQNREQLGEAMAALFLSLIYTAHVCQLNLRDCILKKMSLNGKKYPIALCKVRT